VERHLFERGTRSFSSDHDDDLAMDVSARGVGFQLRDVSQKEIYGTMKRKPPFGRSMDFLKPT